MKAAWQDHIKKTRESMQKQNKKIARKTKEEPKKVSYRDAMSLASQTWVEMKRKLERKRKREVRKQEKKKRSKN